MPQQKQFKVLLLGDSCIDKYVYGEVKRLNPEAPVPVLNFNRIETKRGMCLNVEANLRAFGIDVTTITHSEKIVKTRYIDQKTNQQLLRVDEEVDINPYNSFLPNQNFDAIVISDYNKGFITEQKMFDLVKDAQCPVFIDSKKTLLPSENCFIKINESEYNNLREVSDNMIVTLGDRGSRYQGCLYETMKIETRDIVGAGDTFLSALVYGYLSYGTIEDAIPLANISAGVAVSHPGTYVLTKKDVKYITNK